MPSGPVEALLIETFGMNLLAYLCGVERELMEHRVEGDELLPTSAESVFQQLGPLAESFAKKASEGPGRWFALNVLGRHQPDSSTSLGNVIRLGAGGELPEPVLGTSSDSDLVKSLLFRLARDAYPVLLVPPERPWGHGLLSLRDHPAAEAVGAAAAADEELVGLFPDDDPSLGKRGILFNSLGGAGSFQSVLFGETIIRSAWSAASMRFDPPTLTELLRTIDSNVDLIREALGGGHPDVPALLVFTGVTMSASELQTPWGRLRPLTQIERLASPTASHGAVTGADEAGNSVTVSYAGELALETTLPYAVLVRSWDDTDMSFPDFPFVSFSDALRRRTEGVQLAVFLALDRPAGNWATARLAWRWIGDPFSFGSMSWLDTRSPAFVPYQLGAADCEEVAAWTRRIEDSWTSKINIAIRRTLSAAHERTSPADRLVDAVIAWENLFGTSEGEPRFRVSAAMAWLLGSDPSERAELQSVTRGLYDDRSKIVHGADFDERVLWERANNALTLARRSLQVLLRDRPDVLELRDGAARSLRLILDG